MFAKDDTFKEQKGASARQIVLLLGPMRAGKTELTCAVKDLKKVGERSLSRFLSSDPENPKSKKTADKATALHVDPTKPSTPTSVSLSRKIRMFMASLYFQDGGGHEERQVERIQRFTTQQIKPKPKKWKDGVLAVVVFNICEIIANDLGRKRDVEASYRDFIEIWGRDIHPIETDEESLSLEDSMRGKRTSRKKTPFRPPMAVVFVGSHLDCVPKDAIADAEQRIAEFVRGIEAAAQRFLEMPPTMAFPPSRTVLADLVSINGRIQFAKDFYKARVELTEVMKEEQS